MITTTADTKDGQDGKGLHADAMLAAGLSAFAQAYPDLVAGVHTDPRATTIRMREAPVTFAPRVGWMLHVTRRQGRLAALLHALLRDTGGPPTLADTSSDALCVRHDIDDTALVSAFLDRVRALFEHVRHGRSASVFAPWTRRAESAPAVEIDAEYAPAARPSPPASIDCRIRLHRHLASALALARMDDALLVYDDDDARAIGDKLSSLFRGPIAEPTAWLHVHGQCFAIDETLHVDESAWASDLGIESYSSLTGGDRIALHSPYARRGGRVKTEDIESACDGRFAAEWLLARLTEQIAKAGGLGEGSVTPLRVDKATGPTGARADTGAAVVVQLLPGCDPDGIVWTPGTTILDLFGILEGPISGGDPARHIACITSAIVRLGGELAHAALDDAHGMSPAVLEALLLELREPDAQPTPHWLDFEDFAETAARLALEVVAWNGPQGHHAFGDGSIGHARHRGYVGHARTAQAITAQHPPIATISDDRPGLASEILSASALASASWLIDPSSDERIGYAALHRTAHSHAARLHALGLPRGAALVVPGASGIPGVELMLACWLGGWIFVPLDAGASEGNFAAMLELVRPGLVLIPQETKGRHTSAIASWHHIDFAVFDRMEAPAFSPPAVSCKEIAVILFTSGSTGRPKAVLHAHADFLACHGNYGRYVLALESHDCLYTPSRMFFAYGLNNLVLGLLAGANVVLATPPAAQQRGTVETIVKHGVTVFMAVPVIYKLALGQAPPGPSARLRLCISAGERLSARLCRAAEAFFGVPVLDGIGSTEALSTYVSNRVGCSAAGCTGMLVPGFRARLLDESGRLCGIGEPGVLWLSGDTLAREYLVGATTEALGTVDGWFNTQDMFFIDARGRFHNLGRNGTAIKVNACWFSSDRLETVLLTHPAVEDCAVCMIRDEHGLHRPKAYIVARRGHPLARDHGVLWPELSNLAKRELGKDHYPHHYEAVDALPRTSSGKLMKTTLASRSTASGVTPQ